MKGLLNETELSSFPTLNLLAYKKISELNADIRQPSPAFLLCRCHIEQAVTP
jgi:hypothetical protein